jgi:ABC-type amino acid transport substrate-binding protein
VRAKLAFIVPVVLGLAFAEGWAADPTTLRVGVSTHYPPICYREGGRVLGIEPDFARALGQALDRKIEFIQLDWSEQIPALTEGRTDIVMSGMSITPARQLLVSFSNPYLATGQMPMVRREDSSHYLVGFPVRPTGVIGVLAGTTGDFLVQQEFSKNKRKTYKSSEDAAKALAKKRIDIFICDSPVVRWLAGTDETKFVAVPVLLTREEVAWAMRKTDTNLLQSVNGVLNQMNKSGQLAAVLKQWVPTLQ